MGVLIGLAANWLIFAWVIARLPREQVPLRSAPGRAGCGGVRGAQAGMAIYLQTITRTPSGAVFGSTLGLLVFIYYASRFVLFVTAWAATSRENQTPGAGRGAPACGDPFGGGGRAATERRHRRRVTRSWCGSGLVRALLIRCRCDCALHLPSNSSATSGASTAPQ